MSDKFNPISIDRLFRILTNESAKRGSFLGIPKGNFLQRDSFQKFQSNIFNQSLDLPLGVAAGPHSQLSQNIISAWLCGARYMELKTIQTLDELDVSKPCIDMQDEGYNCEWSQELKICQSFHQYLDAWIIIHVLKDLFGWKSEEVGCIFNMSAGYNLEGILKENVQWFFSKMQNCKIEKEEKIKQLASVYPDILKIEIPDCISDTITLSTMHGCPPEEIEKIGLYLIDEKKFHTTIKLNPTLLGKDELRNILNTNLGFKTEVPDEAFSHDLKYPDALKLIKSLTEAAKKNNVFFGLKLTNTLESVNNKDVFPPNEKMMYMSGRALHPISINLAAKLQNEFSGALDISFSAGADCFNINDILKCELRPVTVCSDILKPGGYGRLKQYCDEMKTLSVSDINGSLEYLNKYAVSVIENSLFKRDPFTSPNIKNLRPLHHFDCIHAPCVDTCPTNQDIPEYLYHTAKGDFQKAWEVITRTNPFPTVLGMVCDHQCQSKCTRINYDNPVLIREVKRFISEQNNSDAMLVPKNKNGLKVAVIGAGPSGLSCAFFLNLAGFEVTVYETKNIAGGMVSDAIPSFRLTADAIKKDIDRIQNLGVKILYNIPVSKEKFAAIQKENDFVYIAVGAQKAKDLGIENEDAHGVIDSLKFLSDVRQGRNVNLGKNILVIGGGNTAMDVARTANRISPGNVSVVYRRTRYEMPADPEEVKALLEEGIPVVELTAPEKIIPENGKVAGLRCSKMSLSGKDAKGRLKPVKIEGSDFDIFCDTIIPALGQDVVADFTDASLIENTQDLYETKIQNVFIGGDAMRGGATVIKAVADGRKVANAIIKKAEKQFNSAPLENKKGLSFNEYISRKSYRKHGIHLNEIAVEKRVGFNAVVLPLTKEQAVEEAERCLYCDDVCSVCVTVCPNRANTAYETELCEIPLQKIIKKTDGSIAYEQDESFKITQKYQVLNIADFCNECGNCTTFCPTSGKPFADKPKVHLTLESFKASDYGFYLSKLPLKTVLIHKENSIVETLTDHVEHWVYEHPDYVIELRKKDFSVVRAEFFKEDVREANLRRASEMQ